MVIIRPVAMADLDPLVELAGLAGVGLTTLPKDRALLKKRIDKSIKSFAADVERPGDENYLFVQETCDAGQPPRVVGACGIAAKVGGFEPFYGYKIEKVLFQSKAIKVRKEVPVLTLVAEHDGPCEIGSLFLHPDFRGGGNGRLLQLVRFLFIAEQPDRFETTVVSEIRGTLTNEGTSPFWDALGAHFFGIDFAQADRLSIVNKKFIAELMPKHPIYIPLLPADAQMVIGKPHADSVPAVRNLEAEGFVFSDTVDIFDAGPVISCNRDDIRTIRLSRRAEIIEITDEKLPGPVFMMGTARRDFRAGKGELRIAETGVTITRDVAEALRVAVGETLRFVELFAAK